MLLARKGEGVFAELFKGALRIARERGINLGRIQVVDSVHTIADVNVEKDDARRKKAEGPRPLVGGKALGKRMLDGV